jgi:hypothetical protein
MPRQRGDYLFVNRRSKPTPFERKILGQKVRLEI